MKKTFLYDAHGNPFHMAGARIRRESDGSLSYEARTAGGIQFQDIWCTTSPSTQERDSDHAGLKSGWSRSPTIM